MAIFSLLGGLVSGVGKQKHQDVEEVDKKSFQIADVDKYRADARTQYDSANKRADFYQPKNQQLTQALEAQAYGTAPSLAAEQLKSAQNRNLAQQLAAAASNKGGGALAQRNFMRNQAATGGAIAEQGAQLRLQEQNQARQLLAQQLAQQQSQADALTSNYLQQGFGMAQAQQAAMADMERLKLQRSLGLAGINSQIDAQNIAGKMGVFTSAANETSGYLSALTGGSSPGAGNPGASGGGGGGGKEGSTGGGGGPMKMMAMLSDATQKTEITDGAKHVSKFLDNLSATTYKYKDSKMDGAAPGKRYGILAQDLEKSEAGKSIVIDTPQGKMVDVKQGLGLVLAAQAELNKRLKKMESK